MHRYLCVRLVGVARGDDLSAIRTVRSICAESAEIIRLEDRHQITEIYARTMKVEARSQLEKEFHEAEAPKLKGLVQAAISAAAADNSNELARIADQLLAMEGPHGRTD